MAMARGADDLRGDSREIDEVATLLLRTARRLRRHFEATSAAHDLPPAQASLLLRLDRPALMGDLADHFQCDAANITGLVDRLEDRGLVTRQADAGDRRRRVVTTTGRGRRLRRDLRHDLLDDPPGVGRLTADERTTLRHLLERLLAED